MTRSVPRFSLDARNFDIFDNRPFMTMWIGLLVSSVGDWINYVAMVSLVYAQTHSALSLAVLRLFHIVPILLVAPAAGVFIDRWDRKRTMVIASLIAAVSVGSLVAFHPVWWVFGVYGVITVALAFFNPARAALLPDLVPRGQLIAANALAQITVTSSIVVGGVVGGVIVAGFGSGTAFGIDAVSFGVIALLIAGIPSIPSPHKVASASVAREFSDGLGFLRTQPRVGVVVVAGAIFVFAPATVLTLGVAFAQSALNGGPAAYGELLGGLGVGSALGAGWMFLWRHETAQELVFALSGIALGAAIALLGLSHWLWLAIVMYGVAGFASMVNTVSAVTVIQSFVPGHILGRVFGTASTCDHLGAFVSTAAIGITGGYLSNGWVITASGTLAACVGCLSLVVTRVLLRAPDP